jgi:hypothetical protein
MFESLLALFYLESMYQRVCFSIIVQKKVTIEKLSKELYFLNSVQETMSKRNFPKNCVQEKNHRVRFRFKKNWTKQIEETKLVVNKKIDKTENEINEIEEMKLAANEKIDKTENEINEIEEMKLAANKRIDKTENEINEIEEMKLAANKKMRGLLSL